MNFLVMLVTVVTIPIIILGIFAILVFVKEMVLEMFK